MGAPRERFFGALAASGIGIVRRYSGGPDIAAGCGMLASNAAGPTVSAIAGR